MPYGTEEIRHAYKSKHNLKRENQVILLMITDGEKWHYLAVKKLSALLKGITSKHKGDSYCLNCFHSYRTEEKVKKHKKVCEDHDYFYVEMPEKYNKILKYNYGEKSMKTPFIIYADLESLLEKTSTCHNNPEKSSTTKINKHAPSGYSLFTQCSFDKTKNSFDYYRDKGCMKKFCLDLKKHDGKDGNDEIIEILYKIKFIDSFRFMSTSLSNLVNNLSEGVHNDKCTDCKSYLDYMSTKDKKLIFQCFECKKNYKKDFNKKIIERFANTYKCCNGDINNFILLLRKGVYAYEYTDS